MSLGKISPSKKRETITANGSTVHNPPFRGISLSVADTVTIRSVENGETTGVATYLAAGIIHPIEFDMLTAVAGAAIVVGHR